MLGGEGLGVPAEQRRKPDAEAFAECLFFCPKLEKERARRAPDKRSFVLAKKACGQSLDIQHFGLLLHVDAHTAVAENGSGHPLGVREVEVGRARALKIRPPQGSQRNGEGDGA